MNFNIMVTSKCNLQCQYCYEGNNKACINMDEKIADKTVDFIKDLINKNNTIKSNHRIVFHGGEPLINFYIIKLIKDRLDIEVANEYKLNYLMTTNGTILTNEIIKFIKENNINLSVSVDGTRESHNQNRVFENGIGSYDTVINNLLIFKESGIKPRCRMTYRSTNVNQLYNGILDLAKYGLEEFVPVADFYDPNWSKRNMVDLEVQIDQLIQNNISKRIKVSLTDPDIICSKKNDCFGGITSYTISETGEIFPCLFTINEPKFIIGSIFNEEYVSKDYLNKIIKERFVENNNCHGCNAEEYCLGAQCKFLNYRITKKYNVPPVIHCKMMQVELNTYKKINIRK